MNRAERFLDAFNSIEYELKRQSKADKHTSFTQLVRASAKFSAKQRELLLKWADLRNVIVHTPRYGASAVIADPREELVVQIETQLDLLVRPPRVLDVLKPPPPRVLPSQESIQVFLQEVALPNDFSQSPVRMPDGTLSLITTNAFARWIATAYDDGGVALDDAPISRVLEYREPGDAVQLAPRGLTAVAAWAYFSGERGVAPTAIAITETGKSSETPLALVVKADVPQLLRALRV